MTSSNIVSATQTNKNLLFRQHPAFTWVRETRDVYLPAGLLEFPVMVEALPVWTAIGPLGWIIGRLIGRAFAVALKEFADTEVHPDNRYDSFYYDTYMVRYTESNR